MLHFPLHHLSLLGGKTRSARELLMLCSGSAINKSKIVYAYSNYQGENYFVSTSLFSRSRQHSTLHQQQGREGTEENNS